MTLGPSILLMAFVENSKGLVSKAIVTIGRVPFFYYLLHIALIHISALIVQFVTAGQMHPEWYSTAPYTWMEEQNRWSLSMLYMVFVVNVIVLYFACQWYEQYKSVHPEKKWLKFL